MSTTAGKHLLLGKLEPQEALSGTGYFQHTQDLWNWVAWVRSLCCCLGFSVPASKYALYDGQDQASEVCDGGWSHYQKLHISNEEVSWEPPFLWRMVLKSFNSWSSTEELLGVWAEGSCTCPLPRFLYRLFIHRVIFLTSSLLVSRLNLSRKSGTSDPLSLADPVILAVFFMFFRFKSIWKSQPAKWRWH